MKVHVTVYPWGQPLETDFDSLDEALASIKGWVSLHQEGAMVSVDLQITA